MVRQAEQQGGLVLILPPYCCRRVRLHTAGAPRQYFVLRDLGAITAAAQTSQALRPRACLLQLV